MTKPLRAVFLDRDGVLVEDEGPLCDPERIRVLQGVADGLKRLKEAGFLLVGVSNQTVVARGLLDEAGVVALQGQIEDQIESLGGPRLDRFYFCPHHPEATVDAYRQRCTCRKPSDGLLRRAQRDDAVDLAASFLVGDRPSDVAAGASAGCQTVWVHTGRHSDAPIVSDLPVDAASADHECAGLAEAVEWILSGDAA